MTIVFETFMKYWVQALCAGMAGCLIWVVKRISKLKQEDKAIKGAVMALLRDRINQACKYHLQRKCITTNDYEVLQAMFKEYFEMGGNGCIHRLYDEIQKLPVTVVPHS